MCTVKVRKSPQARAFFRATCSQVGIMPLELLLWIRTRWGSLFKFIEHFIHLKAVHQFFHLSKLLSNFLTGNHKFHPSCGRKWSGAKSHKEACLCGLSFESPRLGAPREYKGCTLGKIFLFSVHSLTLLVRNHQMSSRHFQVCAHPLSGRLSHVSNSYQVVANYGFELTLFRTPGCPQWRH